MPELAGINGIIGESNHSNEQPAGVAFELDDLDPSYFKPDFGRTLTFSEGLQEPDCKEYH